MEYLKGDPMFTVIGRVLLMTYPFEATWTYMEWYYKVSYPCLICLAEVVVVYIFYVQTVEGNSQASKELLCRTTKDNQRKYMYHQMRLSDNDSQMNVI
ncbi:transmembrane protein, putative [Medicago truncatula]|uniref:Transmembrane protein, putative n=1 Tax=Medicago truncatula TaxID=3880 RepID=G7ILK4_MEDTR|nr:transmembrane protein, putative [Medicago truncatula]